MLTLVGPVGEHNPNQRVAELQRTMQSARATAVERYGATSKAAYVVTFAGLTSLFQVYLECLDTAQQNWVAERVDDARRQLHDMFRQMAQSARAEIRRTPGELAGRKCDLLNFDAERMQTQKGRQSLQGSIVPLDELLAGARVPSTHLYCLTERDRFVLYSPPLSHRNLMAGAERNGLLVKHTMLVDDGEAVVCAGEVHVAAVQTGHCGVFLTSASGHFQPDAEAELVAAGHLVRRAGLRADAVCLLSHPGFKR